MAFNPFKILKGLIIQRENTLTPDKIEITPNGTASTTTTIQSSQTANRTLTLPDATDTLTANAATQALTNKTIDADLNTITNIENADIKSGAAIDATKIHDGSVDNTEFGYLNGVTSSIQTQLTTNATDISNHINDISDAHDASAISNVPSGNLVATTVQGALDEIQTELDAVSILANDAADKNLSNLLAPTAINQDLLPDTTLSKNIGSSTLEFQEISASSLKSSSNLNVASRNNAGSTGAVSIFTGDSSGSDSGEVYIGSGTAAGTRGEIILDGSAVNVSNAKITNLAAPTAASDAVNKEYADSIAAGLDPKAAVRVATTASLGGSYATTPNNGRFTGAATSVDSVSLTAGDRVLVKDQVDQKQNGIYVYDGAGQYTRSSDMDGSPSSEVSAGNYTFTTQGTLNSATGYVLTGNGTLTLNTDNLVFTQFSGGSSGASRFLDNLLSPTAINQDLLPSANNTRDIGSSSLKFKDAYLQGNLIVEGNITTSTGDILTVKTADGTSSSLLQLTSGTASAGATGGVQITSGNAVGASSGNIVIQTGTSSGGSRGQVALDGRFINVQSGALNIQQGQTAVPNSSQQSLTIPSSGATEGLPLLTASDSTVRDILTTGPEGLPQAQNLIDNGDAEGKLTSSTSILVPYADAAQSTPVDGTGGTPNVTTAVTATTPLAGSKSYTLIKDAVNRQGQGWAIPFTVNPSNRARVLSIKFDYIVDSGTFVAGTSTTDSDVTVYIYDVTNSTLIQPSSFRLLSNSTTIADQFQAEFQTSQSGSSYRLIFHCATTSASAYTLKVDNIIVSPSEYVFGTPISDWQSYTPTVSAGFGTATNISARYRRIGDSIEIQGSHTNGTVAASLASISLPSGLSLDSAKLSITNTTANPGNMVGNWSASNASGQFGFAVTAPSTSTTLIYFGGNNSVAAKLTPQNGSAMSDSSVVFAYRFVVPIAGSSSSVQMADSTSTRIVDFSGYVAANQALTANTTNINLTADKDSHSAWSTNTYTVPVPGDYLITGSTALTSGSGSVQVYLNGVANKFIGGASSTSYIGNCAIIPNLKTGDTLTFRLSASQTIVGGAIGASSNFSISRISGPAQIASSEKILFSGYVSTNQALTANTTNLPVTSIKDTHSAWTGSTYVCPIVGDYEISFTAITTGVAGTMKVYRNGSLFGTLQTVNTTVFASGTLLVENCVAGDILSLRCDASLTISGGAATAGARLGIKRIPGSN